MAFWSHDFEGSKGHVGVTGVKSMIFFKKFQLKQKTNDCAVVLAYELSLVGALSLFIGLNSEVIKGHFRVNQIQEYFQKIIKNQGKMVELFYLHR